MIVMRKLDATRRHGVVGICVCLSVVYFPFASALARSRRARGRGHGRGRGRGRVGSFLRRVQLRDFQPHFFGFVVALRLSRARARSRV